MEESPRTPFASSAWLYRNAGWQGVIPIGSKPEEKSPPAKGYTGWAGRDPSGADIQAWIDGPEGARNIGLHLPPDVYVLDVDTYGPKNGQSSLTAMQEKLGPLPPTWVNTARNPRDGGHYFFRADLPEGRVWKDHPGTAIESLHVGHRYAVVWPSIHPEGMPYHWYDPAGELYEGVPTVADLPELPEAWILECSQDGSPLAGTAAGRAETVATVKSFRQGEACPRVTKLLTEELDRMSRADSEALHKPGPLYALTAYGLEGHAGVPEALTKHHNAHVKARVGARGGDMGAASAEWFRMVQGAVGKKGEEVGWVVQESCECDEPKTRNRKRKPTPQPPAEHDSHELKIGTDGEMAYWLRDNLGTGRLSGFFLRHSEVVYTPAEGEAGYVELRGIGSDGPAEVRPATGASVAARVQYAYSCFRWADKVNEDGEVEWEKLPHLFPAKASATAVLAPESMPHLRTLGSVTHTPLVRGDGSLLDTPGYDKATQALYLPGEGVNVPTVSAMPTREEVSRATGLLAEMTAGFPFDTPDDRVNYYGLLLTPLLRELCPPAYKMFGLTAHQPGSGKTLLAEVAGLIHGSVMRSEMPEDEAEMRKQATSILAGTTAPLVHIDNVTGVVRSSTLAGLLTAGQAASDRELGSNRVLTTVNDRVWVLTGNNIALGGDLVRRTVLVKINPDMIHPEDREFAIADLKGWVRERKNDLLWSLLVMVRGWVAAGSPLAERKQSDSYALWAKTVGGILQWCGVEGDFDNRSGEQAATGGDDEDIAAFLDAIWAVYGDRTWTAKEMMQQVDQSGLDIMPGHIGMDVLPTPIAERVSRDGLLRASTVAGRWLGFRQGRWVNGAAGPIMVAEAFRDMKGKHWRLKRAS